MCVGRCCSSRLQGSDSGNRGDQHARRNASSSLGSASVERGRSQKRHSGQTWACTRRGLKCLRVWASCWKGVAAQRDGLTVGDRIISRGRDIGAGWKAFVAVRASHPGKTLLLDVMRAGEAQKIGLRRIVLERAVRRLARLVPLSHGRCANCRYTWSSPITRPSLP